MPIIIKTEETSQVEREQQEEERRAKLLSGTHRMFYVRTADPFLGIEREVLCYGNVSGSLPIGVRGPNTIIVLYFEPVFVTPYTKPHYPTVEETQQGKALWIELPLPGQGYIWGYMYNGQPQPRFRPANAESQTWLDTQLDKARGFIEEEATLLTVGAAEPQIIRKPYK